MKRFLTLLFAGLLTVAMVSPASAHFMVLYTPETAVDEPADMDIRVVFTHPAKAGGMMDMGGVREFYAMYQRGDNKPQKIGLKDALTEITWKNPESSAPAFAAKLPRKIVRSAGDYVFVLVPGYYLEKDEDIYMQQITKLIVNVGGVPGNWAEPVGLPCEIVPLIRPYGMWAGNVFKARVLSEGKPVPGAEVEVEYMNHMPDLQANAMPKDAIVDFPHDSFVTQTIVADEQGYITYGIPKAGWWGFAALGIGPDKKHADKVLSQDAVIWIKAVDMQ